MDILFATDLDATLISKQYILDAVLASDTKNGSSYISMENFHQIKQLSKLSSIVPVTSRGVASYKTIDMGVNIQFALVECGALLLVNGQPDMGWEQETIDMVSCYGNSIGNVALFLKEHGYMVKNNNQYSLDYKGGDFKKNKAVYDELKKIYGDQFEVAYSSSGIYVSYMCLNKGNSLKRFLGRYPYDYVVCAGDSFQDESMMEYSDESIGLGSSIASHKYDAAMFYSDNHAFSSFVLRHAIDICNQKLGMEEKLCKSGN